MSRSYTQTVVPVSRVPERIFGWTAWILLLIMFISILVLSLTTFQSNEFEQNTANYVTNVIVEFNKVGTTDEAGNVRDMSAGEMLGLLTTFDNLPHFSDTLEGEPEPIQDLAINFSNWTIDFFKQMWLWSMLMLLPLITGIFGLLTIRNRFVSGILLLISAILTAPLIAFMFLPGLIPFFFVIAAILLFVRKNKVITHEESDITTVEHTASDSPRRRRELKKEEKRLASRKDEVSENRYTPKRKRAVTEDTLDETETTKTKDDIRLNEDRDVRTARDSEPVKDNKYGTDDEYEDYNDFDDSIDETKQFKKIDEEDIEEYGYNASEQRRRVSRRKD